MNLEKRRPFPFQTSTSVNATCSIAELADSVKITTEAHDVFARRVTIGTLIMTASVS